MNQPKYKIGQEVWRMSDNHPSKERITGIAICGKDFHYYLGEILILPFDHGWRQEKILFPTKEELIKSLI